MVSPTVIKKNNYLDVNDDNDFGFTFTDESEINRPVYTSMEEEVTDLKDRLHAVQKIFLPFLENLSRDPDKPMIKWPNRKEVIDKQIKKLNNLTNI
ncbi:hypothetical protein EB001_12615 [bacterium]|jgi:hypothetical protein|nr:hypothetical protein [bacterium]